LPPQVDAFGDALRQAGGLVGRFSWKGVATSTPPPSTIRNERSADGQARSAAFGRRYLPTALLGILFTLVTVFIATQFRVYGRTWDEPHQDWYGEAIFQWYRSRGADSSFMQFDGSLYMHQHGPFFEFVIAAAQHLLEQPWGTDGHWHIRALVCGIAGALGFFGMALCGFELGGWWGAFLAAAGLAIYPRYTGAIFNNSKDVPFTVGMIFVLWVTFRLVRHWGTDRRWLLDSALLGLFIGAAASVRINAFVWYVVMASGAAVWWLLNGRRARLDGSWRAALKKQAMIGLLVVGVSYLAILALWPYITLYPIHGLIDSFQVASRYPWNGILLFDGEMTPALEMPRRYALEYLVIGSPPLTILLGLVGLAFIGGDLVCRRTPEPPALFAAALFACPLIILALLRPSLYNATRLFLFVVPGLVLLGVVGLMRLWSVLRRGRRSMLTGGVAALLVVLTAGVIIEVRRLYPFEYMYFSPVVGGYGAAKDKFETDYWAVCQTAALEWLTAHQREYPASHIPPTVGRLIDGEIQLSSRLRLAADTDGQADFFIDNAYFKPPPAYVKVHAITREGIEVCTISVRHL
jgi:hypothetical protein